MILIAMAAFTREDFEDVYSTARMAHMGQKDACVCGDRSIPDHIA